MPILGHSAWQRLRVDLKHVYRGLVPSIGRHNTSNTPWWCCYHIDCGSLRLRIGERRCDLEAGDWVVLPPGRLRRQDFSDDARIISINMVAGWSDGRALFDCPEGLLLSREGGQRLTPAAEHLLAMAGQLFAVSEHQIAQRPVDTVDWLNSRAATLQFVALWYNVLVAEGLRPQPHHPADARVASALTVLQPESVGRCVPYELLQERCGLARAQLDRCFRAQLGRTPKQVLEERCLVRAQDLLQDPERPIKQVAAVLGFTDAAHFGRWFRRVAGLTPKAFRVMPQL